MSRFSPAGWTCLWVLMVALPPLLPVAPALAEPVSAEAEAAYQENVRRGLQEFSLEHWNEAKVFFAQAHAMQPSARTLRGLALASYELRDYVAAIAYTSEALSSQVRPLKAEMRSEMQRILEQSRRFVSHLQLRVEPKGATIRIDGKAAVFEADGQVVLNPGVHELVAQAPSYESATRTLQAEGGDNLEMELSLRGSSPPDGPSLAVQPPPSASSPRAKPSDPRAFAPWIVVGVSAAVAIAGGVLVGLSAADTSRVENAKKGTAWSDVKSANASAPALSAAGFAMLGIGVAGAAAGIAWKFWPRRADRNGHATLHIAPQGVRLTGSF